MLNIEKTLNKITDSYKLIHFENCCNCGENFLKSELVEVRVTRDVDDLGHYEMACVPCAEYMEDNQRKEMGV